jgi:aspartate aminotransferase
MAAITEVAVKHNLYIMSDEIYEHLLYDGVTHVSPASLSAEARERTIIVSGFAKTFAMTGWRLGTIIAPEPIAKAVAKLQSQTSSNATTFAQWGALSAYTEADKTKAALDEMLVAFDRRRKLVHAGLNAIDGIDCLLAQGAFYLFPNISSFGLDDLTFCERLLDEQKVAAVPGSAFGAPGFLRISYATADETLQKGLDRLGKFCAGL